MPHVHCPVLPSAMAEREEVVCRHCKEQCWVEGDACQEGCNKKKVIDCLDGFFVRLLILDDIKENQKEESDSGPRATTRSVFTPTPERSFHPRPPR